MDIAGLLPWFDDRPRTTHDDLSQLLIDLWLKDAAAGRSVASLPWVADGLGRWDKIVLFDLLGIASADIDSGTLLAGYAWVIDGITDDEWRALKALNAIASEDPETVRTLARMSWFIHELGDFEWRLPVTLLQIMDIDPGLGGSIASAPWLTDGIAEDEYWAVSSLGYIAAQDLELAKSLQASPWFRGDQTRDLHADALNTLGHIALLHPDAFDQFTAQPWFARAFDDHEAAMILTLSKPLFASNDLFEDQDLAAGRFVRARTISLPLSGEVDIWVVQNAPFPAEDDTMDSVEVSARLSEQFMGAPFPKTFIIFLVAVIDEDRTHTMGSTFLGNVISTERRGGDVSSYVIRHETAHYYFSTSIGPTWLSEGGANFIESYINDRLGIQSLAGKLASVMNHKIPCRVDGEIVETLHHLSHVFPSYVNHGCHYDMGEHFLLQLFFTMGQDAMSSALRDLYLSTVQYGQHTEETIYQTFLRYAPADGKDAFQQLYRELHGGPYAYTDTSFADDHGDDTTEASRIEIGQTVSGLLDYRFDVDYFRFSPDEGQQYRMSVNHGSLPSAGVTVYSADGWPQYEYWVSRRLASSGPEIIWTAPSSEDYYFVVRNIGGQTGPYTLSISPVDG